MASTGDDASETESVPDELFQRSSSAVAGSEHDDFQHAQPDLDDHTSDIWQLRNARNHDEPADPVDRGAEAGLQEESQEDYSDEGLDRENRFEGPASTWRFYTESERALTASLDQERANDLALHLYNAHAFKARLRAPHAAAQTTPHRSKKAWMKANDDGTLPWHPDAHWTAWPVKLDDVPRKGETFGTPVRSREEEKATYRMPVPWKPSADLEEEVKAIMLKTAKEQLWERERARPDQELSASNLHVGVASPRKRKRSRSSGSTDASTESDVQASSSDSERHDDPAQDDYEAVNVFVDEDEAGEILQPSVRNIISKLDDLLLGLHKSRKGHGTAPTSPRSRSRYERRKSRIKAKSPSIEDDEESNSGVSDEHLNPTGRKRESQPKSRSARNTSRAGASDRGNTLDNDRPKPKRKQPLNPRDWSEVLGIASLVGWDPAVVQRARERCSSLFGEDMSFHGLKQDSRLEVEGPLDDDAQASAAIEGNVKWEEVGFSCPVEKCARSREPWPARKTWRWREHLKRSHGFSKQEIERVEGEMRARSNESADDPDTAEAEDAGAVVVVEQQVGRSEEEEL